MDVAGGLVEPGGLGVVVGGLLAGLVGPGVGVGDDPVRSPLATARKLAMISP